MKRGILYLAFGEEYDKLASYTAEYSRKYTDLPFCVLTNLEPEKRSPNWKSVKNVKFTFLPLNQSENRAIKTSLINYTPYEETFFIDCDAAIQNPGIEKIFDYFQDYDVIFAVSTILKNSKSKFYQYFYEPIIKTTGLEYPLVAYSSGFFGFKKSEKIKDFFEDWNKLWVLAGKTRDMPPLACVMKKQISNLKLKIMGENLYCSGEKNYRNINSIVQHRWKGDKFFQLYHVPKYIPFKPFDVWRKKSVSING